MANPSSEQALPLPARPAPQESLKKLIFRPWTVPIALLVLCLLAFGLLAPWLGFIQDDWYLMWMGKFLGPKIFLKFFENERPFLAGIYMLTMSLIGKPALAWQLFAIACRWVTVLAVWWTLKLLWPQRILQVTWIAFLFAVYPGFKQQYISVVYSHALIILAAFIFSLGAMVLAAKTAGHRPVLSWLMRGLGVLAAIFSMFSSEYYFGLELLRPVFLWIALGERFDKKLARLKHVVLEWLPYLAMMVGFLIWRVFIFKFPTYQPRLAEEFFTSPLSAVSDLVHRIVEDGFNVSLYAWVQVFDIFKTTHASLGSALLHWGVVLVVAAAVIFYLLRLRENPSETRAGTPSGEGTPIRWCQEAIFIGVFSLLVGGWPYWFTGLPVEPEIPNDRFTLTFMFGVSILLVGLIELLIRTHRQKIILLGVLIGLAAGLQIKVANSFRQVHTEHGTLFHQLAWRAPDLRPGTSLLTNDLPISYSGDNSLTGALNWIYATDYSVPKLDFTLLTISKHLGQAIPDLIEGQQIKDSFPSIYFTGSTSQSLVVFYAPPSCLHVVDPRYDSASPKLPPLILRAAAISHPGRILASGSQAENVVDQLFGQDPSPGWCYYFEKADLARQNGEWKEVTRLGDQAAEKSLEPAAGSAMEYLPFIEAYARTGKWGQAFKLTQKTLTSVPVSRTVLCETWARIQQNTEASGDREETLQKASEKLDCTLP